MATVFVRTYTGDVIKSLHCVPVGVLFELVLYHAVLCLVVAGYLKIKLKKITGCLH